MPARLLLLALALALAACRTGADAPPGDVEDVSEEAPDPLDPFPPDDEGLFAEDTFEAPPGDYPDSAVVLHPPADDAPPPPVALRGAVGSCDVRAVEPVCFAFTGPGWTVAAAQAACGEAPGGVYGSAACPTAERVGECVHRPEGDVAREVVHTFYAPMDPLIAEAICDGAFRAF